MWTSIGSLSKLRRRRERELHQTKGLMSKTIAVHVRYKSLYFSLPFSAKQQHEMIKFCLFWRTLAIFWISLWNWSLALHMNGFSYLRNSGVNPFFAIRRLWRRRRHVLMSSIGPGPYANTTATATRTYVKNLLVHFFPVLCKHSAKQQR